MHRIDPGWTIITRWGNNRLSNLTEEAGADGWTVLVACDCRNKVYHRLCMYYYVCKTHLLLSQLKMSQNKVMAHSIQSFVKTSPKEKKKNGKLTHE